MPKRLPLSIVFSGFLSTVAHAVRFWLHYTLVALAWLGVVPLTACRIYRTLFTGSVSSIISLPINVFSTENITYDILQGCAVVTITLLAFIGLVWLREQILHGGGPEWLEQEVEPEPHEVPVPEMAAEAPRNEDPAAPVDNLPVEPDDPEIEGVDADARDVGDNEEEEEEDVNEEVAGGVDRVEGEAAAGGRAGMNMNNLNLGDDGQWNPMDWDRAAEELTWERLLGLDGSLVFLEHVFWVVSLNTLFILVFGKCPSKDLKKYIFSVHAGMDFFRFLKVYLQSVIQKS